MAIHRAAVKPNVSAIRNCGHARRWLSVMAALIKDHQRIRIRARLAEGALLYA